MIQVNSRQVFNAVLVLVILYGIYGNFTPHKDYPYPVHVDEWKHVMYAKDVITKSGFGGLDPFLGEFPSTVGWESTFHILLATLHMISGISWLSVSRYIPSVFFILMLASVFLFTRRLEFGLEAVAFSSFIPTTVRILGPGFLVPVALGMVFIPLGLFLVNSVDKFYVPLLISSLFLLRMHPPTALVLFVILMFFSILNYRQDKRKSLWIIAIILLSFLVTPDAYQEVPATMESVASSTEPFLSSVRWISSLLGFIPTAFFVLGVYLLAEERKPVGYSVIIGSIVVLLWIVVFYNFNMGLFILYERGFIYLMLLMSIIAGFALFKLRFNKYVFLVGLILLLIHVVYLRESYPYYHLINQQDYDEFLWIKENAPNRKAIMDPWKAIAFPPVAERLVYSRIPQGPSTFYTDRNWLVWHFFNDRCNDTDFLIRNNISLIYSPVECNNTDLVNLRDSIYIIK